MEKYKIVEVQNHEGLEQILELTKLGLPVIPKIDLERKSIGPKAKEHMGNLLKKFSETKPVDIISSLEKNGAYTFDLDNSKITLEKEDFIVDFEAKEGFAGAKRESIVVFISTTRNREMMAKGLVKDIARRLQTLRKERGYNPTDILNVASILDLDDESKQMMQEKSDELAFLVRVKKIDFIESCKEYKEDDIDGQKIKISVE